MPSPIYPGYYPGKPLYRDRRAVSKAHEIKMNAMEDFLSRLYLQRSLPAFLYEEELKTLQESLVIEGRKQKMDPSEIVAFGEEDLQEMKGAAVRVSVNPKDWIEDPWGTFTKSFITKPLESITNPNEYRAGAKGDVWGSIIKGEESVWGAAENPYQLYDGSDPSSRTYYGVSGKTEKGLHNVSKAAVAYMQSSASTKTRNTALSAFNREGLEGWTREFIDIEKSGELASLSPAQRAAFLAEKESLVRKTGVVANLNVFEKITSDLVEGGDKILALNIRSLGRTDTEVEVTVPPPPGSPLGTAPTKVKIKTPSVLRRDKFEKSFIGLRTSLNKLTSEERDEAKGILAVVGRIDRELFDPATGRLRIDVSDDKIFDLMSLLSNDFHGLSIYKGSIGGYTNKLTDNLLKSERFIGILNTRYVDASGSTRNLTSKESRNLFRLTRVIKNDWEWEALGDALSDLSEGKIPNQVIWKHIVLPRISRYAPSTWAAKYVKDWAKKSGLTNLVTKYQAYWDSIQKWGQNTAVGKLFLFGTRNTELIKAKVAAWLANLISGAIAASTGGLSLIADRVIRVVVRFVANKLISAFDNLWKAIKTRDYDFFADTMISMVKVVGGIFASCFGVILIVVLFLSMLISVFSSEDATKVAVSIEGRVDDYEDLKAFGGYTQENCPTDDVLSLTFANNSSNGPARAAHDIVNKLMRGFWCYWNRNPDYDDSSDPDDLFDEARFQAAPFATSDITNCADCLFWCTWLPYIAYADAGQVFDPSIRLLSARNMYNYFYTTQTFINPDVPGAVSRIRSGDLVFINTTAGTGWHVAMVYYVDQDEVMTIHSNAGFKEFSFTVSTIGTIQSPSDLKVVGFGRPR